MRPAQPVELHPSMDRGAVPATSTTLSRTAACPSSVPPARRAGRPRSVERQPPQRPESALAPADAVLVTQAGPTVKDPI